MLSSCDRFLLLPALALGTLVCSARAQQSIGELYATDASVKGSVILAGSGTSVLSGSAIQAGAQAATLKLDRGGDLLVCPGTNLNVTASQNGRAMLFSVSSGELELNYPIGSSADTLLTPDFRLLLPGPGTVHVAVRVSPNGDACVQSLPWNATALVVSETMGDATYQVKSDEAVLFKGGHISDAVHVRENCGCRLSQNTPPIRMANAAAPPTPAEAKPVARAGPSSPSTFPPATTPLQTTGSGSTPAPTEHVAVEAPFIFHGDDPYPDLTGMVATLKVESQGVTQMETLVLPPPGTKKEQANKVTDIASQPEKKRGFFAAIGAFLAGIFH
jgi:hypothetical protein